MRRKNPSASAYHKLSRKIEKRYRVREDSKELYGKVTARGKKLFAVQSLKYIMTDQQILQILLGKRTTDDYKGELIANYALNKFQGNKVNALKFISEIWKECNKTFGDVIHKGHIVNKKFGKHKNAEELRLEYVFGLVHLIDLTGLQIRPIVYAKWILEGRKVIHDERKPSEFW